MKPTDYPTVRKIKTLTPKQFAKARNMPLDLLMRELERGNVAGAAKKTIYRIAEGAVTRYRDYNLPKAGRRKAAKKGVGK
jgi:hypothetical protein